METDKTYKKADLTIFDSDSIEELEKFIKFRPGCKILSRKPYENGTIKFTASIPYDTKKELEEFCKRENIYFNEMSGSFKEYDKIIGD